MIPKTIKKKGFSLVEMSIVMGLAGSLAITQVGEQSRQNEQMKAKAVGSEIAGYNLAVSRLLSANSADPGSVTGKKKGSKWLKSDDCDGDADTGYLSCEAMPNNQTLTYHLTPTTTITANGDGSLSAKTVWDAIIGDNGREDSMAMGTAALVAAGGSLSNTDDVSSQFAGVTLYCPNFSSYSGDFVDLCAGSKNKIVSFAGTNDSNDQWLRVDHGNTMKHVLEFTEGSAGPTKATGSGFSLNDIDSNSWRQIVNVARIYNLGDGRDDSLIIGKLNGKSVYSDSFTKSNNLLNDAVIADGDLAAMRNVFIKGKLKVYGAIDTDKSIHADDDISSGGDISADGTLQADGSITSGSNITAARDIRAKRDLYTDRNLHVDDNAYISGNLSAGGNATISGALTAKGDIKTNSSLRADNELYVRDVHARRGYFSDDVTVDDRLEAKRIYTNSGDIESARDLIAGRDLKISGDINGTTIYAKSWVDTTDGTYDRYSEGGYEINPGSGSRMNSLVLNGRLTTNDYIQLNRKVSVGGGCSPNGLLARDNSGNVVSCVSGKWKKSGGGELQCQSVHLGSVPNDIAVGNAHCPAGYSKTGINSRGSDSMSVIGGKIGNREGWVTCCKIQ